MALSAGNIAFVGFNADGNDNIAFVALVDINPDEVIIFEDNEWNGTAWVDTNEGAFSWKATSLVTAGTIVRIDNIGSGTIAASTGTAAIGVAGRGGNRGIGANDETIYAYQGSADSPTFITAIANGGFSTANGVLTGTGLTAGTNAIDFLSVDDDVDIAAYNGSRSLQANFASYLPLINNPANWQTQDATGDQSIDGTAPDVPFSSTSFTIAASTPTVTIAAPDGNAAETGTDPGSFRISRTGSTTNALTVNYNVATGAGQATGADYTPTLTGTATIAAGQSSVDITITPVDDPTVEGTETVTLNLNSSANYTVGATTTATVAIADNDTPVTSIDLSTYVRIGRYDLPEPTRTTPPTNSLLAQEVSAVTYNKDTDTLFVVGDGGRAIVQVSKTGQLIDSMTLALGSSPQGTEFYDTEGLTYVGDGKFVLTEERDRQANLFTYVPETTLTRSNVQTVKLGTTVGNIGIEGISFDPQTGGYIAVKEITPEGIFQTNIDFAAGTASNGSATTVNSTDLFNPALAGLADFADVFALSNLSSLNSNLLILSQESGKIVNIDRTGNISSSLTIVSDAGNPLSVADQGNEGITVDKDGLIYVVNEEGGGDINHPQLWVYAPSSFTYANQAPVAVSLANTITSLSENTSTASPSKVANIIVSDDALGTNTLSLTGADANSFEIMGNGLFLKAGTTLDFETKTSYSVSVNVNDTTVGNNPDAITAFTLSVTDVNENPSTSSIFITEVAPWSSGNSPVGADWFELTNKGTSAVDLTGWKIDDSSMDFALSVALNGITSIGAGESVIFLENSADTIYATFRSNWFGVNSPASLQIGRYNGSGVGLSTGGDAVNIYNSTGALQANVAFGASPTAAPFATFDNAALLNNATIATLSAVGVNGAFVAVNSSIEIGSPGTIVSPLPTIAIAATDPSAAETGSDPGSFRISRTGSNTNALTVNYSIATGAGQAISADYTPTLTGTATIAAGQSFVDITITPVADTTFEGTETVTLNLNSNADYTLGTATATVAIADSANIIINEIDSDNPGDDAAEFVELYDGGVGNSDLSGLVVVFYNGNNDQSYAAFDLDGNSTDANGYFVLGNSGVSSVDLTFNGNTLQNGQDAVAIYRGNASDFPNSTPVTTTNLVDAIVYDTSDADDSGLLVLLNSGQPQVNENEGGNGTGNSLQRVPNGSGGTRNTSTYQALTPTPGTANAITPPTPPGVTITQSGGSTNITEGGTTDTYTVVLNTQPTANVTVTITPDSQSTTSATTLTFTTANWNTAQNVTVTAIDDAVIEGTHSSIITQTAISSDSNYNGVSIPSVSATITDNDVVSVITKISQIQGSGSTAALTGTQTIEGIVTRAFLGSSKLNGFYVQEEDADADGNSATSEAIFVFDPSGVFSGNVGDKVRVTGTAREFTSSASSLTQIDTITSFLNLGASTLPIVTSVQLPVTNVSDLERYEGMLVNVSAGSGDLTVTEYFQLGRFGQVLLSATGSSNQPGTDARLDQYTQFNTPSVDGNAAYLAEIAKREIYLDDGSGVQNPATIIFGRGGNPLSASNTLRGGDTVASITGILDERFEGYRIQTSEGVNFTAANPRPVTPPDVGGTLKVASFNVLNFFNGNGTGGGFPTPRGADDLTEFTRQRDKIIQALIGTGADVLGLIELENDGYGPNSAIQDLVNGLNAIAGPGTYTFINPGTSLATDEITVGFIYKPGTVTPVGAAAAIPTGYGTGAFDLVGRKPLAQTFQQISTGESFTAVVNHFKSKSSSSGGIGDADAGDGQGLSNGTRTRQAQDLAAWLATKPTGSNDTDYLVLGDLNAYAQEDPLTTLESAGYDNLIPDTSYSFVFDGQLGSLDYALATDSLAAQVVDAEKWHINADEPSVLDYNTDFKSPAQISSLYNADQFRSSDHDPVLVGLNLVRANTAPTNVSLSPTSVNENVPANTAVSTFTTTDPDTGDTFTYSFATGTGDTDNATFTIAGDSLQINASPDFETKSSYSIRVRSTDDGGLFREEVLTIQVNDLNEAPTALVDAVSINQEATTSNLSATLLSNDTDPDSEDIIKIINVNTTGTRGTVFFDQNTQNLTYTASSFDTLSQGQTAADSFTYTIADSQGLQSTAIVNVSVTGVANNKATSGDDLIFTSQLTGLNRFIVNALAGNDRVIGSNAIELINGGAGKDYLDGKGGNDIVYGGNGDDTILGGLGNDVLSGDNGILLGIFIGSNGNDRLIGFGGGTNEIDLLNGNQGVDTYVLGDGSSVFYASSGKGDYADIVNFQTNDKIELKGAASNYSLGSASAVSVDRSAVGIFTNNGAELIAVVENGLNRNTDLATDKRFVFVNQ